MQPSIRKDGTNITRLRGELPDQAALVGLLNYLYQMRFVVLMVVRTGEEADSALDP